MRSRPLGLLLLTVAVVLAWANGLLAHWWQTTFQFGDTADRGDHLVAAGACLATALLLFAGMLALFVFRPPAWLLVGTALGVGTQLALSITSYRKAQALEEDAVTGTVGHGFARAFELPGSWPLLAVLLVAALVLVRRRLRATSAPAPPPPPDR